jgi:NTP pyrophosphatase (non-canonical NTP hydrolase)
MDKLPAIVTQEECAEVIQAISKCFRFGLKEKWNGYTNKEALEEEIGQLQYMIHFLTQEWELDEFIIDKAYADKHKAYLKYKPYYEKLGSLLS